MLEAAPPQHRSTLLKIALVALVLGGVIAVAMSPLRNHLSVEVARTVLHRLQGIWYGPILFIIAFGLGSVLFLPASVFILAAGLVWGWKLGLLYSVTGGVLGAIASFAITKYVGGDFLSRFGPRGQQIARKLDRAGFQVLLILRLIPLWPFPLFNYAAGLANVRYRDYIASTALGICPSMFVLTYFADALVSGQLTGADAFKRLLVLGMLVGAIIVLPGVFKKRAAQRLNLEEEETPSFSAKH